MGEIYRKKLKISPGDILNLPRDIYENIFSRLPIKSLVRFKSVSKPWYFLISDSKFARFHLDESKRKSDSGTLLVFRLPKFHFLKFTNHNFELEKLKFPRMILYHEPKVLSCCDGLVLLKNSIIDDTVCVLWNPSTRTYTEFSCPYRTSFWNYTNSRCSYGLCYNASSDDYKFVLTISSYRYAVYSYKNNSWKEKQGMSNVEIMPNPGAGLFVNGALHWVTTNSRKDSGTADVKEGIRLQRLYYKHCTDCGHSHYMDSPIYACNYKYTYELCCFDPRDDKFKKLSTPSCFNIISIFGLTDLGGQLCLYRNTYGLKTLEIWMMKKYDDFNSWIKFLTIENVPSLHKDKNFTRPLCLTNKSDIVLYIYGLGIVVYNPKENKFCEVHISGADKSIRLEEKVLSPYFFWTNSLVLPNRIRT